MPRKIHLTKVTRKLLTRVESLTRDVIDDLIRISSALHYSSETLITDDAENMKLSCSSGLARDQVKSCEELKFQAIP